jgi:hypothetical protein
LPATSQYDVMIDGVGFMIDPETYRAGPATSFAPKTRTGDAGFGDLLNTSAWAQSDYGGGFGYPEWDAQHQDRFADGTGIDVSHDDLRLGRDLSALSGGVGNPILGVDLWRFAQYHGYLYAITTNDDKVYRTTDGVTWSLYADISTDVAGSVATSLRSIWVSGAHLYIGSGSSGQIYETDGAGAWNISYPGVPDGASGYWGSAVTFGLQTDYGSGGGSPAAWAIAGVRYTGGSTYAVDAGSCLFTGFGGVSFPYERIEAIAVFGGTTYVATVSDTLVGGSIEGALYRVAGGSNATLIHTFYDNAITSFQTYGGKLLAGSRVNGVIWAVDTSGVDILFTMPELAQSGTPPTYSYPIRGMAIDNDRLYVPFNDAAGRMSLYQFDGTGWCRFAAAPAGAAYEPRTVVSFHDALLVGTTNGTYRAPRQYAASGTLITSWFDADLSGIDKAPASLTFTFAPLVSGQSLTIDYALDDAATWTSGGTANTVGATELQLAFPSGLTCNRIRFRFTLTGPASATTTIKLRSSVLAYQILPDVKREWRFATLLAGCAGGGELIRYDNTPEPMTAEELSDALWASKALKAPVSFTDIDGSAYSVWFDELAEEIDRGRPRQELATRGLVRLQEA